MFAKLPENNPLAKYKRSDIHISWAKLSAITGISKHGLLRIAKIEDLNQFGNIPISTNVSLKKIGIDLEEYYVKTNESLVATDELNN